MWCGVQEAGQPGPWQTALLHCWRPGWRPHMRRCPARMQKSGRALRGLPMPGNRCCTSTLRDHTQLRSESQDAVKTWAHAAPFAHWKPLSRQDKVVTFALQCSADCVSKNGTDSKPTTQNVRGLFGHWGRMQRSYRARKGPTCKDWDKYNLGDGEGHAPRIHWDASTQQEQRQDRRHEYSSRCGQRRQYDAQRCLLRVHQEGCIVAELCA